MSQLNRIFRLLHRTVLVVLLVSAISVMSLPASVQALPFFDNFSAPGDMNKTGNRPYGERESVNVLQADRNNDVDSATINRIQNKAEDKVGSRPIGDTGLKNIRKLGENVPETADKIVNQTFGKSPNNAVDRGQNSVNGAANGAKHNVF